MNGLDQLGTEPFLVALARSSDDAIIGKTLDGLVVFWNAAAERLYGYRAAEMLGRDIAVLIPLDRPQELSDVLARVGNGEIVRNLRTQRRRKDGATIPVSVTVSPVLAVDGTVIGASTITHDLTLHLQQMADLREAQRRVAEAQATFETLQASAPVGLGFIDREFRITHINEMLASVNGSPCRNSSARPWRRLFRRSGPRSSRSTAASWRTMKLSSTLRRPARPPPIPANNATGWRVTTRSTWASEIIGIGIVAVDITERRRAEEFRSNVMDNMAEGLLSVDAQGA